MNAILCRYGELFLKAGNRPRFERRLVDNVRRALQGLPSVRIDSPHGRILVRLAEADIDEGLARLERVFGLVSVSPVAEVAPDIDTIRAAALTCANAALARDPGLRRSFRIEARRSDKRFPMSSYEISCDVGKAIEVATGIGVNLTSPALVVGIEVGSKAAYVYADIRPAPGGLPVESSGRAVLLLSGGIDSPVAGWLAAKRGLAMDALYFHSPPFIGEKSRDKVVTLARMLARWQVVRTLYVVSFTDVQKKLREAGPAPLAVVLYRRMMMRVADLIADQTHADALVTGENLGQVASQTIGNLATIEAAARRIVLRPLVTYDKTETIVVAKKLGTFDTSILPFEDCCSLFVPAHPSTAARLGDVLDAEKNLDVAALATAVAASAETLLL